MVALGEGLQTSYWRLGRPENDWLSVDLDSVIDLREELLPTEDRVTSLRMSALDRAWLDRVDPGDGVLVTAEGLLMYLEPDDALALIADCAARFPGGALVFDSIPKWFSDKTLKGMHTSDRYTTPPMPFAASAADAKRMPQEIAGVASAHDILVPPGRGPWASHLLRLAAGIRPLRDLRPSITLLEFAA